MLIGISPVIGPELLSTLFRMGHGDEIVLADAFFTGDSLGQRVIRADGLKIPDLLDGILRLINLDDYVPDPLILMEPVKGDSYDPAMIRSYRTPIEKLWPDAAKFASLERFAFYERARKAFAVVMTGETIKYGNLIVKKGVIPLGKTFW